MFNGYKCDRETSDINVFRGAERLDTRRSNAQEVEKTHPFTHHLVNSVKQDSCLVAYHEGKE